MVNGTGGLGIEMEPVARFYYDFTGDLREDDKPGMVAELVAGPALEFENISAIFLAEQIKAK